MNIKLELRTSIAALMVAAALAGCAGTPQQSAAVAAGADGQVATATAGASDGRIKGITVAESEIAAAGAVGPDLKRSVYYEFDVYEVKPEYRALVEGHAAWLRANPGARLMIIGNTDERGTSEYNLALGQRRAESVARMMLLMGVKSEQIEAVSHGKEKPRAGGHDEASWAENRRSDFAQP